MRGFYVLVAIFLAGCTQGAPPTVSVAPDSFATEYVEETSRRLTTETDPVEFGRLRAELWTRWSSCVLHGMEFCADLRSLFDLYDENIPRVAAANPKCETWVSQMAARDWSNAFGMPEACIVIAAGIPDDVNETALPDFVRRQLVYGQYLYLYTENGRLSSYQRF